MCVCVVRQWISHSMSAMLCFLNFKRVSFTCVHFEAFVVELQLDSGKRNQWKSMSRTLFLDSRQATLVTTLNLTNGESSCHETSIYLRVSYGSLSFFFLQKRSFFFDSFMYNFIKQCFFLLLKENCYYCCCC